MTKKAPSAPAPANSASQKPSASPALSPLSGDALKSMVVRLGLILLGLWLIAGLIAGVVQSSTTSWIVIGVAVLITGGVVGAALYAVRRARKQQDMAGLLAGVKTDEDRKRAMEQLEANYKSDDPAALFARAQLELQEDPRKALSTLERIPLAKVMATTADEARSQRALIHLLLSEVTKARDLVDGIDLSRHSDARSKAMMSSVTAEAWARSGQVKKAEGLVDLFNPEDDSFEQLRPQIWRARAFVAAYNNDSKAVKRALRKMLQIDVRLLAGLVGNSKLHPLLLKEARLMLEQSGQMPRKMTFQRQ